MTRADIIRLLIKSMGILTFIMTIVFFVPNILLLSVYKSRLEDYLPLALMLIFLGIAMHILMRKTDQLIRFFKIDQGFEFEKVDSSIIDPISLLKVCLIMLSFSLILYNIPEVITQIYYIFKESIPQNDLDGYANNIPYSNVDYYQLITSAVKIVIGYLLLSNLKRVANWTIKRTDF